MSKIRLAQPPFLTIQGEGPRTGKLTIFVRFAGCNLRCPGFFQHSPTKPETYIKPLLADPKSFKTLDEFPVVEYGCDTLYAIDPKFKHLWLDYPTASDIVNAVQELLPKGEDGLTTWVHPTTGNEYDICFTGGEPLLQQDAIIEIINGFDKNNKPACIQFETNGTQNISEELRLALPENALVNISPKLFNVTGEQAWHPEIINDIIWHEMRVSLKFVVNDTDIAFDELDSKVKDIAGSFPIYVMPVGSSFAQQSDEKIISSIARRAVERGYHVSGRLHCILFGNDTDR